MYINITYNSYSNDDYSGDYYSGYLNNTKIEDDGKQAFPFVLAYLLVIIVLIFYCCCILDILKEVDCYNCICKNIICKQCIICIKNIYSLINNKSIIIPIIPYKYNKNNIIQCSICLENITSKGIILKCNGNHIFHKKCISTWLKSNSTCPLCREKVYFNNSAFNNNN